MVDVDWASVQSTFYLISILFLNSMNMNKHILFAGLLSLSSVTANAQPMFSASKGLEKYALPLSSTIEVGANGCFRANYDSKTYELPLGAVIGLSTEEMHLPITVKDVDWKPGVSSLQSGSNGLFSLNNEKFGWHGDNVFFSDYEVSGTVVDTIKNVRLDASNNTRMYGDVVDLLFYKVATGETGMYSLPSNTYCEWKESTHVGKYGVLVLSYGIDAETGARMNNVVGVAKWFSQLDTYVGVSGKEYKASGTVEYFDDIETAKDVTLNTKNFSRSKINGDMLVGSLSAPTWNYLSAGTKLMQADCSKGSAIANGKITYRALTGTKKPTAEEMENKFACRFDSPDENSVIADYFFTATDPSAAFQYPKLKSSPGIPDDQHLITECNVWKGGTCMYMVPSNGTTFSKYRKFDGYIHARMVDGSEYSQHISINKTGVITADGTWTKEKDATISVSKADSYEDNGKLQYYDLKFLANILSASNGLDKNVVDYAKAHAVETDLNAKPTLAFIPKANIYVPYSFGGIVPEKRVHFCNYSFLPLDDTNLGFALGKNGVALTIGDDITSTYYEKAHKFYLFTDGENRMIDYTLNECGGISDIEWYE